MGKSQLVLKTTPQELAAQVKFLAAPKIQIILDKASIQIEKRIADLLRSSIETHSVIESLGDAPNIESLQVAFGLTDGMASEAASQIVNAVISAVRVERRKSRRAIIGSLVVNVDPVLATSLVLSTVPASTYTSNGHLISWLDWLLTKGTQVIIGGYEVISTVRDNAKSRSGGGFMLKTGSQAMSFSVPSKFAGTAGDNFITKTIFASRPNIENIIRTEITRLF